MSVQVSVVIPTYQRCDSLRRSLLSLCGQDFPAGRFEVIVADTGSTDGTAGMVAALESPFPLRYLGLEKRFVFDAPIARNAGARAARGELLIFLDSDMLVPRHFVREHAAAHAAAPRLCVCGGYVHLPPQALPDEQLLAGLEGGRLASEVAPYQAAMLEHAGNLAACRFPWSYCYGGNLSVARADLEAVGMWDESHASGMMANDTDLAYRLHRAGVRFLFRRAAVSYHDWGATAMEYQKDRTGRVQRGLRHTWSRFPDEELGLYIRARERDEERLLEMGAWAKKGIFPRIGAGGLEPWLEPILSAPRPRISLVLLAPDEPERLDTLLAGLGEQACAPGSFEALLYDRRAAPVGAPTPEGCAELPVQLGARPYSLRYFPAAEPPRRLEPLLANRAHRELLLSRTSWALSFFHNHSLASRCRGDAICFFQATEELPRSYVAERLAELAAAPAARSLRQETASETAAAHSACPPLAEVPAIVMCGGRGKRIREITEDRLPKPLLPVGDKTLLEHTLEVLRENGIRRVILAVSHQAAAIRARFGNGAALDLEISYAESTATPGVLRDLLRASRSFGVDSTFYMTGADEICQGLDLRPVYDFHLRTGALATIIVADGSEERIVEAELAADGRVVALQRGPTERSHTVVGHTFVSPAVLERVARLETAGLEDSLLLRSLLPELMAEGKLYGYLAPMRRYLHVGDPAAYHRACGVLAAPATAAIAV